MSGSAKAHLVGCGPTSSVKGCLHFRVPTSVNSHVHSKHESSYEDRSKSELWFRSEHRRRDLRSKPERCRMTRRRCPFSNFGPFWSLQVLVSRPVRSSHGSFFDDAISELRRRNLQKRRSTSAAPTRATRNRRATRNCHGRGRPAALPVTNSQLVCHGASFRSLIL